MRRAVLDVNVIVSGILVPHGHPAQILQAWRDGRFLLITSEAIIQEVKEVLNRPRIRKKIPSPDTKDHRAADQSSAAS